MDKAFAHMNGRYLFNYLHYMVVYCRPFNENMEHGRAVHQRLQEAGFTLNPNKMTKEASEVKYLGHSLSTRENIKAYPRPTNLRTLKRFIGITGFYTRFVPDFS